MTEWETSRDRLRDAMAGIAQGVINIGEGHCYIEYDSPVYRAMTALLDLVNERAVGVLEGESDGSD